MGEGEVPGWEGQNNNTGQSIEGGLWGRGWGSGRFRKGAPCACTGGGCQSWRLLETSAVCIEKESAGQEGGVLTPRFLKCSPEHSGVGLGRQHWEAEAGG